MTQAASVSSEPETFSVTPTVYQAVREVALAANSITMNNRHQNALLVAGQREAAQIPAVRRFHEAITKGFMKWVHFHEHGSGIMTTTDPARVEQELVIVEQALLTRLGDLAERIDTLRSVIQRANTRLEA
jgi:hypothetical protein